MLALGIVVEILFVNYGVENGVIYKKIVADSPARRETP